MMKENIFEPKLIVGDCRKVMMEQIPENSIDLIVTSPPYNCKIEYDMWDDKLQYDDYLAFMREWLTASYRVLKNDGGRIAINLPYEISQNERGGRVFVASDVWQIMKEIGFTWNGIVRLQEKQSERIKYTAWGSWKSASAPYIYCMSGDTPIITSVGLTKLRDISAGDQVLTHRGNYRAVSGAYNRVHRGNVIDITASNNLAEPIRCTPEHMFFVKKNHHGDGR